MWKGALLTKAAAELGYEESPALVVILDQATRHLGRVAPVQVKRAKHYRAVIQVAALSIIERSPEPAIPLSTRYLLF